MAEGQFCGAERPSAPTAAFAKLTRFLQLAHDGGAGARAVASATAEEFAGVTGLLMHTFAAAGFPEETLGSAVIVARIYLQRYTAGGARVAEAIGGDPRVGGFNGASRDLGSCAEIALAGNHGCTLSSMKHPYRSTFSLASAATTAGGGCAAGADGVTPVNADAPGGVTPRFWEAAAPSGRSAASAEIELDDCVSLDEEEVAHGGGGGRFAFGTSRDRCGAGLSSDWTPPTVPPLLVLFLELAAVFQLAFLNLDDEFDRRAAAAFTSRPSETFARAVARAVFESSEADDCGGSATVGSPSFGSLVSLDCYGDINVRVATEEATGIVPHGEENPNFPMRPLTGVSGGLRTALDALKRRSDLPPRVLAVEQRLRDQARTFFWTFPRFTAEVCTRTMHFLEKLDYRLFVSTEDFNKNYQEALRGRRPVDGCEDDSVEAVVGGALSCSPCSAKVCVSINASNRTLAA